MRISSFFAATIQLFMISLLAAAGIFFVCLKWLKTICEYLSELFLYKPESFFVFGIVLLVLSLVLFFGFYSIYRHRYITIFAKPFSCELNKKIVAKYAKKCLEEIFKEEFIEIEINTYQKNLEIIGYLSSKKLDDILIDKAKDAIEKMLSNYFSYKNKFVLTFKLIF